MLIIDVYKKRMQTEFHKASKMTFAKLLVFLLMHNACPPAKLSGLLLCILM